LHAKVRAGLIAESPDVLHEGAIDAPPERVGFFTFRKVSAAGYTDAPLVTALAEQQQEQGGVF
jgi:hypothetical protein